MAGNSVKLSSKRASEAAATTAGGSEPLNINYTVQTESRPNSNVGRTAMSLTRPAMMGAGLLALGTAALGIFDIFRVPGLQEQIEDLENEIDRLEVEIDRLSYENDRFEQLNQDLNESLADLVILNDALNETATELETQVTKLNVTVGNLSDTADQLTANGEYLQELNVELNQTQASLRVQIELLNELEANYTVLNEDLEQSNELLAQEVDNLENVTEDLQDSIDDLEDEVLRLSVNNAALDRAVTDVTAIAEFMTAEGLDTSTDFDALQTGLNNSIILGRVSLFVEIDTFFANIQETSWKCRNEDIFFGEDWLSENVAMGPLTILDMTKTILIPRMLDLMCLDGDDFSQFLNDQPGFTLFNATYTNYQKAVGDYHSLAMKHYGFDTCPEGDDCLTEQDWFDASYECSSLPPPPFKIYN